MVIIVIMCSLMMRMTLGPAPQLNAVLPFVFRGHDNVCGTVGYKQLPPP